MDLSWWPVPLLGRRLVDQLLPWPPAEHFTGQDEFVLGLDDKLFYLSAANFGFNLSDQGSLEEEKEILIGSLWIAKGPDSTYSQDNLVPLINNCLCVFAVSSICGHSLNHAQDLIVQHSEGVMGVGGHGHAGQSSCLEDFRNVI